MAFDKSQFFQVFYEETAEHLNAMEALLLNLDIASPDQEDLDAIFRAAHSIKGGAGTFGFNEMTEVSHTFESVLDRVRKGTMVLTSGMIDLFLETGDVLNGLLAGYREGAEVDPQTSLSVQEKLKGILDKKAGKTSPPAGNKTASANLPPSQDEGEEDPGFGFFDAPPACEEKEEAEEDPGYGFFEDLRDSENKGRRAIDQAGAREKPIKVGRRVSDKSVLSSKSSSAASIRIDVEKVDQLFNQVGEIVIAQAMLSETAAHLEPVSYERIQAGLAQLEQNTRDLQESVMAIRMVPVRMVFNRFPRLIRDMKRKFNKEVELVTIGDETEIDKGFVEKLVDPLTHLMRNSFDHGIEPPEVRRAAGKESRGTITLRASHQSGNVVIEVSDDGAGLSREKLLEKAAERGIPVNEPISDQEVWQLIFAPGFSTAEKVSDLSGRGVGMDVVKKNVQLMGGHVDIQSEAGHGSSFMIRLPLTLAIIEGMVIRVGKEVFILPLISIIESIRPKESDVKSVMEEGELVNLRGDYLPIVRLYDRFGIQSDATRPSEGVLVVIESGGGRIAVMVDELLGQQQVVIKSMEKNFRKVPGIAGATILGDGHVAFILDVRGLLSFSKQEEGFLVG